MNPSAVLPAYSLSRDILNPCISSVSSRIVGSAWVVPQHLCPSPQYIMPSQPPSMYSIGYLPEYPISRLIYRPVLGLRPLA